MTIYQFLLLYTFLALIVWALAYARGFGHFIWYDFWVGAFYDQKKRILYICPLPCCVIKIERKETP